MPPASDAAWRNVNGHRQFCHSWRVIYEHRFSAMTTIWIVLALVAAAWLVARLVATLRHDGLGSTPPPASHADWSSDLPSHPYRSA
jgi:hypothetical protein